MEHTFLVGHVLDRLRELPDDYIDSCVTSPPYFNLRSYPGDPQVWSAGPPCDHFWVSSKFYSERTAAKSSKEAFSVAGEANQDRLRNGRWREEERCEDCGAWRGQLGQERRVGEFVGHLAQVFREVKRVLKPEGTLFLNLGDSYGRNRGKNNNGEPRAKSLIGVPWKVAFALMEDGWILRSDIVWEKSNAMPDSVIDRPTRSHEYIFLFVKNEKYYYDYESLQESSICKHPSGNGYKRPERQSYQDENGARGQETPWQPTEWRRGRSVWSFPTKSFKGAHFACFAPELVERCLLAGCPPGGTVLDPFGGSGVAAMVAEQHSRNSILIDLDPACEQMTRERLEKVGGILCPQS